MVHDPVSKVLDYDLRAVGEQVVQPPVHLLEFPVFGDSSC